MNKEEQLWLISEKISKFMIEGYIQHDLTEYDNTKHDFYNGFKTLMPWKSNSILQKSANEHVETLYQHDLIEDSGFSKKEILESINWKNKVLPHAFKEAHLLELDDSYAYNKVEYYRLHGQREHDFREHVYAMEKYFAIGLVEKDYVSLITTPSYLTFLTIHDIRRYENQEQHSHISIDMMKYTYANYIFNLVTRMNDDRTRMVLEGLD